MIEQMGYREGQMFYKCPKCCSIKPERAHHCSVCQRCIRKMDHHCPWVNNCVGENNQKYFVLFTVSTSLLSLSTAQLMPLPLSVDLQFYIASISVHTLFLVLTQFAECVKNDWRTCSPYSPPATIFLLLFLTFEGLMFGIFTIIMLATQLTAILNDQTVGALLALSARDCMANILAFLSPTGHRTAEEGGGPLGEEIAPQEHPVGVRTLLVGLVFTVHGALVPHKIQLALLFGLRDAIGMRISLIEQY